MQQAYFSFHFETLFSISKRALILLIFLFSIHSPAQVKCEALFKPSLAQRLLSPLSHLNPFSRKHKLELSSEQIATFKELGLSSINQRPYGLRRGEQEPLFMTIWGELKPEQRNLILEILDNGPADFKKFRSHFSEILKRHSLEEPHTNSFVEHILSSYADHLKFQNPPKKFAQWMHDNALHFEARLKSGELNLQTLRAELQTAYLKKSVSDKWQSEYGVTELPVVKDADNNSFIELRSGERLPFKVSADGKTVKMLVPKSLISRAAWNPIYSEVLQAKIAAGTKPPEVYDGFLATNGSFYLTDGNHRFILDGREKVWIQMSYPAKTASMSISFDAIGLAQPSVETLVDFFNGKLTLDDMIGGANAARIKYP